MTPPLIALRGVSKRYGSGAAELLALKNIDIDIASGEFVAIMGPSGSGKSTAMNILGCLDTPSSGQYLFKGAHVEALSRDQRARLRRRYLGFVFQGFNLLARTSAQEGGLVTAMVVGVYAVLLRLGMPVSMASTAAFVVLVSANAALILPSRTARTDWRSLGAGLTPVSRWVLACTLLALLAVTAIPWLARNFGFLPLTPVQWLAALAAGIAMVPLLHLSKVLLMWRPDPPVPVSTR